MKKSNNNFSQNSTKASFKVTISGVLSALSLVFMMMTSLMPLGTFAFPCLAGIVLMVVVIEAGHKWAWGAYVCVSLLSLFLAGDKEAVVYYIMFFGYYPILKGVIEGKIKNKLLQYFLKFSIFNAAVISAFFIAAFLLAVPMEEYTIAGMYVPWVFLLAGNIFFFVYDKAATKLVTYYIIVLRNKLIKQKYRK